MSANRAPVATASGPQRAESDMPLENVRGVGAALAAQLIEHGFRTPRDLARELPRGYDDFRVDADVTRIRDGENVVVSGTVGEIQRGAVRGRGLATVLRDGASGSEVRLVWFHEYRGLAATLKEGALKGKLRVSGRAEVFRGRVTLTHPEFLSARATGIEGRYRPIGEIPARTIGRIARAAAEICLVPDAVPAVIREREGLERVHDAVLRLHGPSQSLSEVECRVLSTGDSSAHRRLALEELFVLNVAARASAISGAVSSRAIDSPLQCGSTALQKSLIEALPFVLSTSQTTAIQDLSTRFSAGRVRALLQGDVGSGKTVVVGAAAASVLEAGAHVALMVPTDMLAQQHFDVFRSWFENKIAVHLVTASSRSARAAAQRAACGATPALFVGTHALLEESFQFHRLGLVVVDEQHRFGAAARARLVDRGRQSGLDPHVVVVSATPIPRTLAQSLYSDLEIVTLAAHTPENRRNVVTRVIRSSERSRVYALIRRALEGGGSVFVVCAAIGDSDDRETRSENVRSVDDVQRELARELEGIDIAVLHGRMPAAQRSKSVASFRDGSARVLVATTMIEVGVDVQTANLMVIENAERFGLAQLHQLRGRVGRRAQPSACVLVTEHDANERLDVLLRSVDGFEIAEADLASRGSGNLFGVDQSGASSLRFARFPRDVDLGALAKRLAHEVIDLDPELIAPAHGELRSRVHELRDRALEE